MQDNNIQIFCNIAKQRSIENQKAFDLLFDNSLYGNCMSTLREELDSFVRVYFLVTQSLCNREYILNNGFFKRDKWLNETDRYMVDLSRDQLGGWEGYVYKIGCAFTHLSRMHGYSDTNPFDFISNSDKFYIKQYLNSYHEFPLNLDMTLENMIPYLPKVFKKVQDNLIYHLEKIENKKRLNEW